MSPEQAQALLRQEVIANSAVGQALLVLLQDAELKAYRKTLQTTEPYSTAVVVGRGQGIQSIIKLISPTASDAPEGRSPL